MQAPIAIFLGLALIAGAIYSKASISCMAKNQCAVLFNGEVTFVSKNNSPILVNDIESRTSQFKTMKKLPKLD
jgi:hypothetical protein